MFVFVERELGAVAAAALGAGGVDRGVDPAEALAGESEQRLDLVLAADVSVERHDIGPELGGDTLLLAAEVDRDHPRAFAQEHVDTGAADALAGAGDHRNLAAQHAEPWLRLPAHLSLPFAPSLTAIGHGTSPSERLLPFRSSPSGGGGSP